MNEKAFFIGKTQFENLVFDFYHSFYNITVNLTKLEIVKGGE